MQSELHVYLQVPCWNGNFMGDLGEVEAVFSEITRLNPEIIWCTDDCCLIWMCLHLLTLSQKPRKEYKMDYLISIYSAFSSIIQ